MKKSQSVAVLFTQSSVLITHHIFSLCLLSSAWSILNLLQHMTDLGSGIKKR
jgi:hypothetical protein